MPSLVAPPKIRLSAQELYHSAQCALMRQYQAMIRGNRDSVGEKPYHEAVSTHIIGVMGEMAAAKYLGLWYGFPEGTYKIHSDLENNIEVRTRTNEEFGLLVRPTDLDSSWFVLCQITTNEPVVSIKGYILGGEAKKDEWKKDWGNRGKPVYTVPPAALAHISGLKDKYRD